MDQDYIFEQNPYPQLRKLMSGVFISPENEDTVIILTITGTVIYFYH